MKLKHLLTIAALIAGAGTAWAQTDVTSTYITNAGFDESSDFQTGNVATGGSNQRKAVTGWTNTGGDTYTTGAAIGFGTSGQINGANLPSSNSEGTATGGALCLNAAWQSSVWYSQDVTLPAGNYTMTFKVNNVGQNAQFEKDPVMFSFTTTDGSSFSGNVHSYPVNTWTTQTITFALAAETTGTIKIGYKAGNTGSGNTPKLVVDNVKATYNSNYSATLQSAIDRATILNARASDDDLAAAITTAQDVLDAADNTVAYQATINSAVTTLRSAITTAAAKVVLLEGENITFMFENADFESGTPVTVGITTYDYDAATNGTHYSRLQVVEGWTIAENGNAKSAGIYQFGQNPFLGSTGASYQAPSSGSATGEEKALGIVAVWSSSAQYKQDCTLPAGSYIIEVPVYNTAGTTAFTKNLIGFVENGGTEHLATAKTYATGSWITEKIIFELENETAGYLSLGYTAANAGSGGMPHLFIDGVKVTYTSPIAAAYQRYQDALDAANAAIADAAYTNVTGAEKIALQAAIDATPENTKEGYNDAADALDAAVATFTAAAPAYDAIQALNASATAAGVEPYAITSTTTADDIYAAIPALENSILVAEHATDVTAFNDAQTNYPYEIALGTWTTSGAVKNQASQHWNGNAEATYNEPDSWSSNSGGTSSWTQNVALPAGNYVLQIAGRRSNDSQLTVTVNNGNTALASASDFPAQGTGYGIDLDGNANFDMNGSYANSGNGWGWEWRLLSFTLAEESTVTIAVNYSATVGQQWASFTSYVIRSQFPKEKIDLLNAIASANEVYNGGANVGTGVFQIPASAGTTFSGAISDAQGVYDDNDATVGEITDAISALESAVEAFKTAELNAPAAGQRYYLKVASSGHSKENNAIVVSLGATSNNNKTGYGFSAAAEPVAYMAQALIFTQVSGNNYNISVERPEGTVYLTYGALNESAAEWKNQQIQGTTEAANKGEFKIEATSTANVFKIFNTIDNNYIDCQEGGALYTDTNIQLEDFTIAEASQASVTVSCKAGKFGTVIFPFTPDVSTGFDDITFYSCETVNGATEKVQIKEVDTPVANVPYLIKNEGSENFNKDLTGWGTATADSYTDEAGLLTGVYTNANINGGNRYVLQTPTSGENEGVQAFYKVTSDFEATPYKCYLTYNSGAGVKALGFEFRTPTSVRGLEMAEGQNDAIFNLAGQRVQKAQRGLYIVNGKKVLVK